MNKEKETNLMQFHSSVLALFFSTIVEGILPNSVFEARIIMIPKPDKCTMAKRQLENNFLDEYQ
jgi:hypothetical protein